MKFRLSTRKVSVTGRLKRTCPAACRLATAYCLLLLAFCFLATGCRYDMQNQPKMKPYRSSSFFTDGLSSRAPVEGTIPRGFLKLDTEYYTGKKAGRAATPTTPGSTPGATPVGATAPMGAAAYPDDVEMFPIPVTKELVTRGKERYEIFCAACHGFTGNGDGIIVRRGFRRAASFNDDRLRQAPVGHFFDAITNGWGAMPSYSPQIPVQDRWAIISYVRALQLKHEVQQPPASTPGAAAAKATPAATPEGGAHR